MSSSTREDIASLSPWRTTPPRAIANFLVAVFFIFSSFAFILDAWDLGREPTPRFVVSILLSGLFATGYAAIGITLRQRAWMGFVPLFFVHIVCMGTLAHLMPDAPALTQLNSAQLGRLHSRLVLDAIGAMASITLGYIGFLMVSIAEARRRIRLEVDKASFEGELAAAREIQRVMVPEVLPPAPGYAIESIYRPAAQVGGDFFQVIPLTGGRSLVIIGDVSGKGLSAAMIVSMLIGMLRTISQSCQEPSRILADLNAQLFQHANGGFVTCLAVRLDPDGRVSVANAGHLPPLHNGEEVQMAGSIPLGVTLSAMPEQLTLNLQLADRLTLLTDGIVEARNKQGGLFGFDRVQRMMRDSASPLTLAEAAQSHGQEDDITVISIRRIA
jgi:hypothetical protein